MWVVTVATLAILVAPGHGRVDPLLTPTEGEVLQLAGFGAGLTPSLRPSLWDAEGVYVANHTTTVRQWWHSTRPHLLLTYEPMIAEPTAPRRWIILDVGPNKNFLARNPPVAELPRAGPRPWQHRGGEWLARDCMGLLRVTPAQLSAVDDLRQRDDCATLTWRLTGLGEQHPSLASLAGRFRVTNEYSSGAPVYRADSGAELRRIVSDARSSWVLHAPDDNNNRMAVLDEFTDRINLIGTERFVAALLPGQDFRDHPQFICEPDGLEGGDTDFTLPDLGGYTAIDDLNHQARWSRQQFTEEDSESYELAFGGRPEQHARIMVIENVTRTSLYMFRASLESPRVQLTDSGCAVLRLRNAGFRLTVTLRRDDGKSQDLLENGSLGGWRDVVVPLPGSGRVTLAASQLSDPTDRLAVSRVLVFNETCDQLQGRTSACQDDTCQNGGTCASVSIKHHLCLCPPGFLGARCETPVECGQPPEIADGRVAHLSGTAYLDCAFYSCLPGHAPAETVLDLAWSSCHYDGTWVNIPRCEPLADAPQPRPHLECDFGDDCAGFNTRVDNAYNTDTDEAWQSVERLQTSDILPRGAFLSLYRESGRRRITARLLTPCLDLEEPGCLQLDLHLTNATLQVQEWSSDRVLFHTEEGGRRRLIPVKPRVGPLQLEVRLMPGESEAALDAIRVYRQTCEELSELNDDHEELTWPTWPPPGQTEQQVNGTQSKVEDIASTSPTQASPIILVLVPLVVLFGLVMVLGCSRD